MVQVCYKVEKESAESQLIRDSGADASSERAIDGAERIRTRNMPGVIYGTSRKSRLMCD